MSFNYQTNSSGFTRIALTWGICSTAPWTGTSKSCLSSCVQIRPADA